MERYMKKYNCCKSLNNELYNLAGGRDYRKHIKDAIEQGFKDNLKYLEYFHQEYILQSNKVDNLTSVNKKLKEEKNLMENENKLLKEQLNKGYLLFEDARKQFSRDLENQAKCFSDNLSHVIDEGKKIIQERDDTINHIMQVAREEISKHMYITNSSYEYYENFEENNKKRRRIY
jgi:superfamily II DNA or RNA helicase